MVSGEMISSRIVQGSETLAMASGSFAEGVESETPTARNGGCRWWIVEATGARVCFSSLFLFIPTVFALTYIVLSPSPACERIEKWTEETGTPSSG